MILTHNPQSITVLRTTTDSVCAKTIEMREDGPHTVSYGDEFLWDVESYEASNLIELGKQLTKLSKRDNVIIVYGKLLDEEKRLGIPRRKHGELATLSNASRHMMALDIDGVQVEGANTSERLAHLFMQLPAAFQGAACWYQFTSSYGVDTPLNTLYVRLWFWLDTPVDCEMLRLYAKQHAGLIDPSVFVCTQPIYICSPTFKGMKSPVQKRTGIFKPTEKAPLAVKTEDMDFEFARHCLEERRRAVNLGDDLGIKGDPNDIAAAAEELRSRTTKGSRHHQAFSAACDLLALGADNALVAEVCTDIIVNQGRSPQQGEISNFLRDAAIKVTSTDGYLTVTPLSEALSDGEDEVVPEANQVSGEEVLEEVADYSTSLDDSYNAKLFKKRCLKDGRGIFTFDNKYYVFTDDRWLEFPNNKYVTSLFLDDCDMRFSNKDTKAIVSLATGRSVERVEPKCFMLHRRPARPDVDKTEDPYSFEVFRNGRLHVPDAAMSIDDPQDARDCLSANDPSFFTLDRIEYDFDPEAKCPSWHKFVDSVFPNDPQAQRELQKMFGYCLTSDCSFHKFFMLVGNNQGANGKSTVLKILGKVLGMHNTTAFSIKELGNDHGLAHLMGKRVAVSAEENGERGEAINGRSLDNLKAIATNDPVLLNPKNRVLYLSQLSVKLVMACNQAPAFDDPSRATMRRVELLNFAQSFVGREDWGLEDRLNTELAGIYAWALHGYKMLVYEDGEFTNPDSSSALLATMRREMAPVAAFVEDCIDRKPDDMGEYVTQRSLYAAFRAWAEESGVRHKMNRSSAVELVKSACPWVQERPAPNEDGRNMSCYGLALNATGNRLLDPLANLEA